LNNLTTKPDTSSNCGVQVFALDDLRQESSNEGISSTIGINDLIMAELWDFNFMQDDFLTISSLDGS
jgi:hypothetical protein